MLSQSSSSSKGAKAALASKRFLAGVHPYVAFKITSGLEVFLAFVALKRRISVMASHVNSEVPLLVEALGTTWSFTLKRPLTGVDARVSRQPALVLEASGAFRAAILQIQVIFTKRIVRISGH